MKEAELPSALIDFFNLDRDWVAHLYYTGFGCECGCKTDLHDGHYVYCNVFEAELQVAECVRKLNHANEVLRIAIKNRDDAKHRSEVDPFIPSAFIPNA